MAPLYLFESNHSGVEVISTPGHFRIPTSFLASLFLRITAPDSSSSHSPASASPTSFPNLAAPPEITARSSLSTVVSRSLHLIAARSEMPNNYTTIIAGFTAGTIAMAMMGVYLGHKIYQRRNPRGHPHPPASTISRTLTSTTEFTNSKPLSKTPVAEKRSELPDSSRDQKISEHNAAIQRRSPPGVGRGNAAEDLGLTQTGLGVEPRTLDPASGGRRRELPPLYVFPTRGPSKQQTSVSFAER